MTDLKFPLHMEKPVRAAMDRLYKNGQILPGKFITENNRFIFRMEFTPTHANDFNTICQLGIYIGTELSKPEPLITLGELEAKKKPL